VRALVFAADPGDGFAASRWLERWGNTTLIEHVAAGVARWPVDERFFVLGADAEEVVARCDLAGAGVIIDPEWEEGAAASVRVGLDVLTRQGEDGPALLADAARPKVTPEDVATLIAGHDPQVAPVTVARYRYATAPPYLIEPSLWPVLMGREGDAPLESLWKTHPEWISEVRIDHQPPHDVRTPFDLEHVRPAH
jgi:CTP:molybdopterin cytidylyltransferase MocA